MGATKRLLKQFIRELGHRNPAVLGFMVKDGHDKPGDGRRVVFWPWHVDEVCDQTERPGLNKSDRAGWYGVGGALAEASAVGLEQRSFIQHD
jgi:hypothetical protein